MIQPDWCFYLHVHVYLLYHVAKDNQYVPGTRLSLHIAFTSKLIFQTRILVWHRQLLTARYHPDLHIVCFTCMYDRITK